MRAKILIVLAAMAAVTSLGGCVPLAAGAGGAVVADEAAEERGGNLF